MGTLGVGATLYLPYISPTSPLHLPYISPISPQERAGTVLLADGSDHPRWSETLTSVPAQLVLSPRP